MGFDDVNLEFSQTATQKLYILYMRLSHQQSGKLKLHVFNDNTHFVFQFKFRKFQIELSNRPIPIKRVLHKKMISCHINM